MTWPVVLTCGGLLCGRCNLPIVRKWKRRPLGGSPLHAKALAFIATHSPREILRILGVLDDAHLYT